MSKLNIGSNIEILDSNTASNLVIKNIHNDILWRMSSWEILARTNNLSRTKEDYLIKLKSSFRDIDSNNKDLLLRATLIAKELIESTNSFQNLPFRFAYSVGGIDWGYTYTSGDIIVLRERDFLRGENDLMNLIIHEYCHVYQRFYPDMLIRLYSNWGFQKMDIQNIPKANTATNPDGVDDWIFNYKNNDYVSILLGQNNGFFIPVAMKVINGKCTNIGIKIDELENFSHKFFNIRQLYHPNEIMATLLPLYLNKNLIASDDSQQQVINELEMWLNKMN